MQLVNADPGIPSISLTIGVMITFNIASNLVASFVTLRV